MKRIKANCKACPWQNEELGFLRHKVKKAYSLFYASKHSDAWQEYGFIRNLYNRKVRKAKLASWEKYFAAVETYLDAARICKMLRTDPLAKLGPLEKVDGSFTGAKESLDILLSNHFPSDDPESSPTTFIASELEIVNDMVSLRR